MKKWLRAILVAFMILMSFGLVACGDNNDEEDDNGRGIFKIDKDRDDDEEDDE